MYKNFKFNFLSLVSTVLSTVSIFTVTNIDNQAKAIVVTGDPIDYVVRPGSGYDVQLQIDRFDAEEIKLSGLNTYEYLLGDIVEITYDSVQEAYLNQTSLTLVRDKVARDTVLGFDFDNGLTANDAFGYIGVKNIGLGINEVFSALTE